MPTSKLPDFFSPLLGAAIATAASPKGIAISLGLAFIGGAVGWLGKILMKHYFIKFKEWSSRKK